MTWKTGRNVSLPVWLLCLTFVFCAGCEDGGGGGPSELEGYWVWVKEVENGQVILEVTDEDMEPMVGPSGWPDCPDGILCTRYGIHKVAFGENGRFHYGYNVHTSSDYQTLGTLSASDGAGDFSKEVRFSCAHPDQTNEDPAEGTFLYRFEGGELWVSVSRFSGFELPFAGEVGTEPERWLVFKPVSQQDYYGKYMIRVCQPTGGYECHESCFSDSLVGE